MIRNELGIVRSLAALPERFSLEIGLALHTMSSADLLLFVPAFPSEKRTHEPISSLNPV